MKTFYRIKNLIVTTFVILILLFGAACQNEIINRPGYREYLFEAELSQFSNCTVVEPEEYFASGKKCVGYLKKGSTLFWRIYLSEADENGMLTFSVSCPMGWIGVHNLPQTFKFDSLYAITVNGERVKAEKTVQGSSSVDDSGNYYYWVLVRVNVKLLEGENQILLSVINEDGNTYSSYGNVDYLSVFTGATASWERNDTTRSSKKYNTW